MTFIEELGVMSPKQEGSSKIFELIMDHLPSPDAGRYIAGSYVCQQQPQIHLTFMKDKTKCN
ncbi:hypothetical protein P5673_002816 [Acropora cervicornis]|uniref:Uncharacterized protein n=1 Tax=Acropora cervicornis TaxID=6130 RepID=A0AAD9VG13_ACRCE|nr:hypothetical protein P5673_002816 [Acropora cervicornis]